MRQQTVYLYRVDLKFDLADFVNGRIGIVYKGLKRWAKPVMHGRATITFVVISEETSSELQARLKPTLEEMGGVENTWCFVAPKVAVSARGGDPLVHWLGVAWEKAGEWNKAEDMRHPKPFRRVAKWRV